MTNTPAVELRNVSKVFAGGTKAVDDVSLQIPTGRIVALLGPSGGGKTTTLRLINRLEEATSGHVLVRGEDVCQQRPERLRRSIGYVIQEAGLFPHLSVSTNVATVPKLLGWPRGRVRQRVGAVLEMVGLSETQFGRRMPSELSGGQRQRVGVARALAADPDLLLMDEPFGALDPGTRETLQDEFLRLQAQLKKTVVLVTHDLAEAGKLAEEIVLLVAGQIVQRGPFQDLILRPAGDRVRGFLGRQGQSLALDMLRLCHVLPGLPVVAPSADSVRLSPDLRLGTVLAILVSVPETATIQVDGSGVYSAKSLRAIVLADLAPPAQPPGDAPCAPRAC
jgi:osmoprotectant transport system ATP-binding protein